MAQLAAIHVWRYWVWSAFGIGFLLWGAYLLLTGPYRRVFGSAAGDPPSGLQQFYMTLGMLLYFFAFASPLDHLSDEYLFSAHMVQHMIEVSVMVPLLLKALPNWLWSWAFQWEPFKRAFGFLVNPFVALVIFFLIFDNFHWPPVYELTLVNETFHVTEHILFFFAASFLWWPILSTHPEFPRLKPGIQLLYIFFAFDTMMPPTILILMWNHPLYYHYTQAPVRLWGLSVMSDQKLGSVIMAVFGFVSNIIPALAAFSKVDMARFDE